MYDQIIDDFNIIKLHCEANGNNEFEESAVFELLENLYPFHGSVETVRIVIDMLDAQRIQDTKSIFNNCKTEILNTEKLSIDDTNDNDIIEIEVPKKIHPLIDLTENSTESEEAIIVEKSENKSIAENIGINSDSNLENNDYEASGREINSLSDSDASKHFNEDSNFSYDDNGSDDEIKFLHFIDIRRNRTNRIGVEQSNNDSADIPEMLEENNNDPNNNFNEENADANHTVSNHSNRVNMLYEPPVPEQMLDDLFDGLFDPIPIPGCSKETASSFEVNNANKTAPNYHHYNSFNPVPGCSKDLDISQNIESFKRNDDSIEADIICIQEIIPWAASGKIRFLLMKYKNRSDRKQLSLLKLMNEESARINKQTMKRRSSETFEIENKIPKVDTIDEMNDSLDTFPNFTLESIFFEDTSNDSESSKLSEHEEPTFKMDQNLETSNNTEDFKTSLRNQWSRFDSNSNSSLNLASSTMPVFPNSSNMPTANRTIRKERNETVVSGLLQEQKHLEMLSGENLHGKMTSAPSKNNFKQSASEPFHLNSNDLQFPLNKNVLSHQINDETIEKTVKEDTDNILDDIPITNGFINNSKSIPSPNKHRNIIKQPKLPWQNTMDPTIAAMPRSSNFLRPAMLKFISNQLNRQKVIMPEQKDTIKVDFNEHIAYNGHNNYLPSALQQKEVPLSKRFQLPPATIVHENQSKRNIFSIVTHTISSNIESKNYDIFNRKSQPLETVATIARDSSLQIQQRPSFNGPVAQAGASGLISNTASTSTDVLHQSIYNKLRSIFPDVESSYIKKICINPPNVYNTNDKAYILNALVEHLLVEGSKHLRPIEYSIDQPSIASVSIDEKYEYLLGIFPDANPTYIRDFVVKNPLEQEFEQFIQQKLESRDYPTKEQYMARIKITEQIKQYTTDLNIEKFLELFPDPFKHFEDASRKCMYQPFAMEFLKSLFVKNKVSTISQQYKNNRYILSLTAKALTTIGPDMKSKRVSTEMPSEDIPLLQEIAFIKNKQNIINHLNMLKDKEDQLFIELKEQNLLLTCQCCYNDECMPTKSSECNEGHVFCNDCIIKGTEIALANAEAHVRCFTECQSEFSLATLQKVLPPTTFSALLQKRQTAEVIAAGMDGLVSCPFCHFASIPPPEDKVFKCLNPECMKESCKMCKELNHVPLKCDEVVKTDKARHIIEEKMTEALVRTCYNCKKQFYKEDGCNKMKCTCGALMCYLCDKPVEGYNHFNAQGGANMHLCPLWSDDRLLNAKAVIKVAEDVKKELLKNNPNLKIDTDSLLPELPPKTRGPHDDIPNANQLPEHIMRIANAAQR